MQKIEQNVKRQQGKDYRAGPPNRSDQQYRQWVEELYKLAVSQGDRYLVTYVEQLREYHIALEINSTTRMKDAMKRLEKYFKGLNEDLMTDIDKRLRDLYYRAIQALEKYEEKHGQPENPKLKKLKELILKNYQKELEEAGAAAKKEAAEAKKDEEDAEGKGGKNEEKSEEEEGENECRADTEERSKENEEEKGEREFHSTKNKAKGIVFSRTRESTQALMGWIKETEELSAILRPHTIVGSGDGTSMYKR